MNLSESYLWAEKRTLILPETIEHDTLDLVGEAVARAGNDPWKIYFRSNGGSSRAALAICNLIYQKPVEGHLIGDTLSAATIIFCACKSRWIYPHARFGIHQVSFQNLEYPSYSTLQANAEDNGSLDRRNAWWYATASKDTDIGYWLDRMRFSAFNACIYLEMEEMIEKGMGRFIDDYEPL
jgi:ATP-dependent protease ClpP protease subunit